MNAQEIQHMMETNELSLADALVIAELRRRDEVESDFRGRIAILSRLAEGASSGVKERDEWCEALKKERDELSMELEQLHKGCMSAFPTCGCQDRIKGLEREVQRLKGELADYTSSTVTPFDDVAPSQDALNICMAQSSQFEDENERLVAELVSVKTELRAEREFAKKVVLHNSELIKAFCEKLGAADTPSPDERIEHLESQLRDRDETIAAINDKHEFANQLIEAKSLIETLERRVAAMDRDIETLNESLSKSRAELDRASVTNNGLADRLKDTQANLNAMYVSEQRRCEEALKFPNGPVAFYKRAQDNAEPTLTAWTERGEG